MSMQHCCNGAMRNNSGSFLRSLLLSTLAKPLVRALRCYRKTKKKKEEKLRVCVRREWRLRNGNRRCSTIHFMSFDLDPPQGVGLFASRLSWKQARSRTAWSLRDSCAEKPPTWTLGPSRTQWAKLKESHTKCNRDKRSAKKEKASAITFLPIPSVRSLLIMFFNGYFRFVLCLLRRKQMRSARGG